MSNPRTLGVMPVDVAMEKPCTGVVSSPSDSSTSSGRNGDGIPSNGVDLTLVDGWVQFGVVRKVIHGLVDDLEFVAVQMERVETGITTKHEIRVNTKTCELNGVVLTC